MQSGISIQTWKIVFESSTLCKGYLYALPVFSQFCIHKFDFAPKSSIDKNKSYCHWTKAPIFKHIYFSYLSPMDSSQSEEWHRKISALLSQQLSYEYKAFYLYRAAASYFEQRNVELAGMQRLYRRMSSEELEHADGIIAYMNSRGYTIDFLQIDRMFVDFKSIRDVLERSLSFEEFVLENIKNVYLEADRARDYTTTTFLDPYLNEQVGSIKDLSDLIVNAKRCGEGLGEFLFDDSLRRKKKYR